MAGVMNCDIHLTDKLSQYVDEVRKGLKLPFISPCVNRSLPKFSVMENSLIYGLAGLKNVGLEAMDLLVKVRNKKVFVNLFEDIEMIKKNGLAKGGSLENAIGMVALDLKVFLLEIILLWLVL